jgi:hypothetical protein
LQEEVLVISFSTLSQGWRRAGLFAVGIVGPIALLTGLSLAQDHPGEKGVTAAQKYKNIKVLKSLPADQLIPYMRNYNAALGVKCDFCHVINPDHSGFEKDDKPTKDAARKMILMTIDLNKKVKVVDGKVTCFMCHHGQAEPQGHPGSEGEQH